MLGRLRRHLVYLPDETAQVFDANAHKTIEVPAFAIESVEEGLQG